MQQLHVRGHKTYRSPVRAALLTEVQQLKQLASGTPRLKKAFCVRPPLLSSSPDTSLRASRTRTLQLLTGWLHLEAQQS